MKHRRNHRRVKRGSIAAVRVGAETKAVRHCRLPVSITPASGQFTAGAPVSAIAVSGYNWSMPQAIRIDPEIQGGTPCFAGTRVPVKSLFDYLARGRSLDYFLQQFPSVTREQVAEVLQYASKLINGHPEAA